MSRKSPAEREAELLADDLDTAPSAPTPKALPLVEHEVLTTTVVEQVIISRWRGPPSVDALDALAAQQEFLIERSGSIALLNIIERTGASLGPGVKEAALDQQRRFGPHTSGLAHVITSSGMFGTLARMVVATVSKSSPTPVEVFAEIDPAATWLIEIAGLDRRAAEVLRVRAHRLYQAR